MKLVYCDFLAGYFGGVCGIAIGHPFDTIKTWQQHRNTKVGSTMYDIIIKNNGLNGFYKGFYFPLMTNGSISAIVFGVYGNVFRLFQDRCATEVQKNKLLKTHLLVAGCSGGLVQAILSCPIEVVKIRLQTLGYIGRSYDCMKYIYRHEGMRGLYRGLVPTIYKDCLPFGIYIWVYDWLYNMENKSQFIRNIRLKNITDVGKWEGRIEATLTVTAGFLASVLSWICVVPLDVVKTIMQAEIDAKVHKNMLESSSVLLRQHNWRAFFRGSLMVIGKNYSTLLGYQYCLNKCQLNVKNQDNELQQIKK